VNPSDLTLNITDARKFSAKKFVKISCKDIPDIKEQVVETVLRHQLQEQL
jgi:hypothetical protein